MSAEPTVAGRIRSTRVDPGPTLAAVGERFAAPNGHPQGPRTRAARMDAVGGALLAGVPTYLRLLLHSCALSRWAKAACVAAACALPAHLPHDRACAVYISIRGATGAIAARQARPCSAACPPADQGARLIVSMVRWRSFRRRAPSLAARTVIEPVMRFRASSAVTRVRPAPLSKPSLAHDGPARQCARTLAHAWWPTRTHARPRVGAGISGNHNPWCMHRAPEWTYAGSFAGIRRGPLIA